MEKYFISANELLLDSFRLAEQVYSRGFRPNFIVGVWRGGAPVGIAVQEYLDYRGVHADHIAIRTSSYTDIGSQREQVSVYGLNYVIENAEAEQQLLIVDDVFDSGRSAKAVIEQIEKKCRKNTPNTIKIACPWYKPQKNQTNLTPHFYVHATEKWLVFPHEIKGLTQEELVRGKAPELVDLLLRTP